MPLTAATPVAGEFQWLSCLVQFVAVTALAAAATATDAAAAANHPSFYLFFARHYFVSDAILNLG